MKITAELAKQGLFLEDQVGLLLGLEKHTAGHMPARAALLPRASVGHTAWGWMTWDKLELGPLRVYLTHITFLRAFMEQAIVPAGN